ncbi:MAG: hypothetical protein JWN03_741 [Nocardia sp.]|uniref:DUF4291 domain-containing protein n=1 Tax=Nocardia sp. TaxID=1821 RepID=UPI00260B78C2|nr:DUF4291 domain-containing protein [Nocardia sp.]MCU1640466.1 hypothetical protein [Nocardia sp.]
MPLHEIRADYDQKSIVVYQAYSPAIAQPAVAAQRFVPPFSTNRMTWIKPSFLWMMERSNWGRKPGQERVLAVRITRNGWETALSQAVLTGYERGVHLDRADWEQQIKRATVNVQWDPERTLTGASQDARSIQVGLSRHIIQQFVDEWVTEIRDLTPTVRKITALRAEGRYDKVAALLPKEGIYPISPELARRLYR